MRPSQGYSQFDECSRSISKSDSQQPQNYGAWNTNSVSAQEDVVHSVHALPEQVFRQEQTTTAPKKPLEDRHTSQSFQVSTSITTSTDRQADFDDGNDNFYTNNRPENIAVKTNLLDKNFTTSPVIPIFVESKGHKYRLMQLPDFVKLRDFAKNQDGRWTKVHDDRHKSLLVESRPEDLQPGEKGTGFNIVRATVEWNDINPETLFNTLHDADYRKTWDKKMIDGHNICQLDSRNDIGYYAAQPHWLISKRDFCNMRSWMEFTGGEYIIMNHSVHHADCPEREGFVRARSIITGYYMIPTPIGGTKLIFISHSDPKGSIPAWLVNNLMGSLTPNTLTNLHDSALKYVSWAIENHGTDAKYKWRTPKIEWNDSSTEVQGDAALAKKTRHP